MSWTHCPFRGPHYCLTDGKGLLAFQWLECSLFLFWTGLRRPPASFLALRYEPRDFEVRDFFWSLKPLAYTLRQMFCVLGFYSECFFPHWRGNSQLLFAFEVNLQRAFCSANLPGTWLRQHGGTLCKSEPLLPLQAPAIPLQSEIRLNLSPPGSSLFSFLKDSPFPLPICLSSLDSRYWAKLPFHCGISVKYDWMSPKLVESKIILSMIQLFRIYWTEVAWVLFSSECIKYALYHITVLLNA